MKEFSNLPSKEDSQEEATAIHWTARDSSRKKSPNGEELARASHYLDYLKETNPYYRNYIIAEENIREDLTEVGDASLYELWKKAWGKVSASMEREFDVEEGRELILRALQRDISRKVTEESKDQGRRSMLNLKKSLNAEAASRMRRDRNLISAFRGKEDLLEKCIVAMEKHAIFVAKVGIRHYLSEQRDQKVL